MTNAEEKGEFKLSSAAFKRVQKATIAAYKKRLIDQYVIALEIWDDLKRSKPKNIVQEFMNQITGERGKTFDELVEETGIQDPALMPDEIVSEKVPVNRDPEGLIFDALLKKGRLKKPSKKTFLNAAPSKRDDDIVLNLVSAVHYDGDRVGYIRFVKSDKSARYVFRAPSKSDLDGLLDHPVLHEFLAEIHEISRWGRHGGVIYRCDGMYVHERFGSKDKD